MSRNICPVGHLEACEPSILTAWKTRDQSHRAWPPCRAARSVLTGGLFARPRPVRARCADLVGIKHKLAGLHPGRWTAPLAGQDGAVNLVEAGVEVGTKASCDLRLCPYFGWPRGTTRHCRVSGAAQIARRVRRGNRRPGKLRSELGQPPPGRGRGASSDATIVNISRCSGHCRWERIFKFSVTFGPLVTQRVGVKARTGWLPDR